MERNYKTERVTEKQTIFQRGEEIKPKRKGEDQKPRETESDRT